MAQTKKVEVKERIDHAALTVFARNGYKKSTIKDISAEASVSVGNIYKYYKNKQDIFRAITSDNFVESFKDILRDKIELGADDQLMSNFIGVNYQRFLITFGDLDGSGQESVALEITLYLCQLIEKVYDLNLTPTTRNSVQMIYTKHNEMIKEILLHATSKAMISEQIALINQYHKAGMIQLIRRLKS